MNFTRHFWTVNTQLSLRWHVTNKHWKMFLHIHWMHEQNQVFFCFFFFEKLSQLQQATRHWRHWFFQNTSNWTITANGCINERADINVIQMTVYFFFSAIESLAIQFAKEWLAVGDWFKTIVLEKCILRGDMYTWSTKKFCLPFRHLSFEISQLYIKFVNSPDVLEVKYACLVTSLLTKRSPILLHICLYSFSANRMRIIFIFILAALIV